MDNEDYQYKQLDKTGDINPSKTSTYSDEKHPDIDEVITTISGPKFGIYQLIFYSVIVMGMISGAFVLYSLYYFDLEPDYLCVFKDSRSGSDFDYVPCTAKDICQTDDVEEWKIDYTQQRSIHNWVEQYNLTCITPFEQSLVGSSFLAGTFVGSFILPRLADVVGRKPMFLLGLVIYIASVVVLLESTNKEVMYASVFMGGIGETGRYYVAYVYAVEIFPKRLQPNAGLVIFMTFAFFKVCICLYFMLSEARNWKVMGYVAIALACLSLLLTIVGMPESPRYQNSKKKYEQAEATLRKMNRVNGKADPNYQFDLKAADAQTEREVEKAKEVLRESIHEIHESGEIFAQDVNATGRHKSSAEQIRKVSEAQLEFEMTDVQNEAKLEGTLKELFGIRIYRRNILIMMTVWSFGSFAFFMVPFYLQNIKANIYYLSLATESSEFLASVVVAVISKFLPLKKALLYSCIMIAVGSFAMMFIAKEMAGDSAKDLSRESTIFNTVLILITDLGIVCAFDIAYMINADVFPTILLSTAYGACNVLGRFVSILSPIAANIPQPYPMLILLVFSILCIVLSQMLIIVKK